ncbi:putative serine/threonine protein kinase [Blattamonas nauphoetae]|uniref:Serine/threonine protein kinase n=1 Tax=Blattamonas nauphoetae TaxID=2049346 RepID=A0ABQ9XDW6_9EUKA|nr:putative serine/threonine protein kinase [Blattamonas nauphoetae]
MSASGGREYPADETGYQIVCQIGRGSSALVYKAICIPFNQPVAIKILDLEKVKGSFDTILKEVRMLMLSEHDNVAQVYISFVHNSSLWVVQPLFEGSCLDMIKSHFRYGLDEYSIATILKGILSALDYIHNQGQIHRDVKAANLLLDAKGNVYLGDFGVSGYLIENGMRRESRNTFVGTPCWMAPEVIDQNHGYDYKADIWSLGITAIELASGSAPYSTFPPVKVLMMILHNPPPKLEDPQHGPSFSHHFHEFVDACLQRDPVKRPTALQLSKHQFIVKKAKDSAYLQREILSKIPPIDIRAKLERDKLNISMEQGIPQGAIKRTIAVSDASGSLLDEQVKSGDINKGGALPEKDDLKWDFGDDDSVDAKRTKSPDNPIPLIRPSPLTQVESVSEPTQSDAPLKSISTEPLEARTPNLSSGASPSTVSTKTGPVTLGRFQLTSVEGASKTPVPVQSKTGSAVNLQKKEPPKEERKEAEKRKDTDTETIQKLTELVASLIQAKDKEERRKEPTDSKRPTAPFFHLEQVENTLRNCQDDILTLWKENRRLKKRLAKLEKRDESSDSEDDAASLKTYEWTVKKEEERLRKKKDETKKDRTRQEQERKRDDSDVNQE